MQLPSIVSKMILLRWIPGMLIRSVDSAYSVCGEYQKLSSGEQKQSNIALTLEEGKPVRNKNMNCNC